MKRPYQPSLALAALLAAGCGASPSPPESPGPAGAAEPIAIVVTEQGFVPPQVRVRAGEPVTLAVTRRTDRTCATELVLAEHGIDQKLPLDQTVHIRFTPTRSGTLGYACAMDMIKGTIVVE